jgi:hypothetical protein
VTSERLSERTPFDVEAQSHVTFGMFLGDSSVKSFVKNEPIARAQSPCALGKGPPHTAAKIAIEGDLDYRLAAASDEPHRKHFGIIDDEEITRTQQYGQVCDLPVFEAARARNEQQTSGIARFARVRRDQLARQIEIKIRDAHQLILALIGDERVGGSPVQPLA